MTTVKLAVSLPPEVVAEAKRAVRDGQAPSVSAYVADALAQRQRVVSLETLLDEMDDELGEPGGADYAWADRALGLA